MLKKINKTREKEAALYFKKTAVRRFFADLNNAKDAAHELFSKLNIKQAVYVLAISYGIFTKRVEYSVRLLGEGVRPDSTAIIYTVTQEL